MGMCIYYNCGQNLALQPTYKMMWWLLEVQYSRVSKDTFGSALSHSISCLKPDKHTVLLWSIRWIRHLHSLHSITFCKGTGQKPKHLHCPPTMLEPETIQEERTCPPNIQTYNIQHTHKHLKVGQNLQVNHLRFGEINMDKKWSDREKCLILFLKSSIT